MNFLNVFEQRVGDLLGAGAKEIAAPFSFKKLAKKASRELEAETYVIDGVDTAPGLFTILVSSDDDMAMRPLYAELTNETAQFIEGQAQSKGYVFVGKPVVRFMADPSLKSGRFSVFAENVDAQTLDRLRDEEAKFMGADSSMGLGGAAAPIAADNDSQSQYDAFEAPVTATPVAEAPAADILRPRRMQNVPLVNARTYTSSAGSSQVGGSPAVSRADAFTPAPAPSPAPAPAPQTQAEIPATIRVAKPAAGGSACACRLVDHDTGHTYNISAERTTIGRERTPGGIALRDLNVSRRHAELIYNNSEWVIRDLGSTNGTIVNNINVDTCLLRSGDLITLGLITLEFQEI